jgi:glyoxylase-like metal-dependent hydrolase (beta-lactamase superfamily II)
MNQCRWHMSRFDSGLPKCLIKAFLVAAMMTNWSMIQAAGYVPRAQAVTDGVYAIIGPIDGRTYDNHALNNNLGFIVTPDGVILIDSGASRQGAELIEAAVSGVTDRPVRWVINTGSQDHRWLGNDHFRNRGAQIIALERTVNTQRSFANRHMDTLGPVLKDRLDGTRPMFADNPHDEDSRRLELGGVEIDLMWLGDAHFPGDAVVWLPGQGVLFSGDLIYVDRMLGIHPWSDLLSWQRAFKKAEQLNPGYIVPGHGSVSSPEKARRDTGDYLDWLVHHVSHAVEEWEPIEDAVNRLADAAEFSHLKHFDNWHRTNVNRAYLHLESADQTDLPAASDPSISN